MIENRDIEGIAVVLSNMAVCLISLNDFPRACRHTSKPGASVKEPACRFWWRRPITTSRIYTTAWRVWQRHRKTYAARRACEATGDAYHFALCHLDLSDVYLELNLSEEARTIAHEGFLRFEAQGMRYEAARRSRTRPPRTGSRGKRFKRSNFLRKPAKCLRKSRILSGAAS